MRILVTAAGGSGGRFLTEALQMAGHYVIGTDCDPWQLPLAVSDEKHLIPKADNPRFCHDLHRIAEPPGHFPGETLGRGADLVMPQSDAEVAALCTQQHIRQWTLDTKIFLPQPETVRAAQDKWESYLAWSKAGVPTPMTIDGLLAFAPNCESRNLQDKYVCKLRKGSGGSLMLRPRTIRLWNAWREEYAGLGFITQEWLEGVNCVADLIFWRGNLVAWAGREVLAWQMAHCAPTGITGASRVTVLHLEEGLREIAEAAVRALPGEAHGIFGVDTIRKDDGSYWVTEVNAGRFNAPGPALYARAGWNLAAIAASLTQCSETTMHEMIGPKSCQARSELAYAMLHGPDTPPVYLTKAEWEALGKPCES